MSEVAGYIGQVHSEYKYQILDVVNYKDGANVRAGVGMALSNEKF
jgi:hypothetical protein